MCFESGAKSKEEGFYTLMFYFDTIWLSQTQVFSLSDIGMTIVGHMSEKCEIQR